MGTMSVKRISNIMCGSDVNVDVKLLPIKDCECDGTGPCEYCKGSHMDEWNE
jgi:hypothetical protein